MTAAPALLPRGVWPADYLIGGHRVLQAIDSRGNCLRRVKLTPDIDEQMAREWLDGLLEHDDPPPLLRLVTDDHRPAGTLASGVYLAIMKSRQARRR